MLAGNALALALLTLDVDDYFKQSLSRVASEKPADSGWVGNTRQFSLTVVWTFYGATALVLGLLRRLRLLRYGALALLFAAAVKVLVIDTGYYDAAWHVPVFNQTFMAYALLVLALGCCARFYGSARHLDESEREAALATLLVVANILALGALSLEAFAYYDRRPLLLEARPGGVSEGNVFGYVWEGKLFLLSLVWTLYGAGALLYGISRKSRWWRYGGLAVLALAALKLSVWGLLYYDAAWHALVFNRTFAAFALMVAALSFVIRRYARTPEISAEAATALPALVVAANVLAVVGLSAEASGYFAAQMRQGGLSEESLRDLRLASQLALSVLWALYGGALLVTGRMRRARLLRLMALVLLGLTTLKVFFWDLASLDRVYRIVSFIVLGAILLVVSYLYQKTQQQQRRVDEAGGQR